MDKCGKCGNTVQKDGLKCSDCSSIFHPSCVGNAGKPNRKNWKCESCSLDSSSTGSRASVGDRESGQSAVLEAISAFRREVNEKSDQTLAKLSKVQEDLNGVVADVGLLKNQFSEISAQCESITKTVEHLESDNSRLNREVTLLKREIADLQQHSRKNNLMISGVPITRGENVYQVLETIARILNVPCDRYTVSAAHRLPSSVPNDKRPPSIIVCFVSRNIKSDWMFARRKKGSLSARDLHASFPDTPIYLNDHLTPQTRELFNGARNLKKEKKLAVVWTSDGRVLARKTISGPPFRVWDMRQLRDLGLAEDTTHPPQSNDDSVSEPK